MFREPFFRTFKAKSGESRGMAASLAVTRASSGSRFTSPSSSTWIASEAPAGATVDMHVLQLSLVLRLCLVSALSP